MTKPCSKAVAFSLGYISESLRALQKFLFPRPHSLKSLEGIHCATKVLSHCSQGKPAGQGVCSPMQWEAVVEDLEMQCSKRVSAKPLAAFVKILWPNLVCNLSECIRYSYEQTRFYMCSCSSFFKMTFYISVCISSPDLRFHRPASRFRTPSPVHIMWT